MHRSSFRSALATVVLGLATLISSCGSTQLASGTAAQVRFHEYRRGGKVMTIVNETHTDRVELYSNERSDASTKVASDEIMNALLEQLRKVKFEKFALDGSAPTSSTEWSQAIEVQTTQGATYMIVRGGIGTDEAAAFRGSRDAFLAIYNNIYAAQTVKSEPGKQVFEQSPMPKKD